MALAQQLGGEILSADSMQVYRGMDIGTAKPTLEEQRQVRHHLIDRVEANETFTVSRFVDEADRIIRDDEAADGKGGGQMLSSDPPVLGGQSVSPLIVTGGTPLYYKALFDGLFEGPAEDASIRRQLAEISPIELHRQLKAVDPAAAERIHVNDIRRMIRALEVYQLTGQPISSWQTDWTSGRRRLAASWFGLSWPKEALNRRINARVKAMIDAGWIDETRSLLKRFGALSKTAAGATGYAELIEHLAGRSSLDDALERIKISTRQLAKRQMKWFRRFEDVTWLDGDQPVEVLAEQIIYHLHSDRTAADLVLPPPGG